MKEKESLTITLGLLQRENIRSIKDFEEFLDKNEILDLQLRKEYMDQYRKFLEFKEKLVYSLASYKNLFLVPNLLKPINSALKPIFALEPIINFTKILEPFIKSLEFLKPITRFIEKTFAFEWYKDINEKYKIIKNEYLVLLIKSYTIFKQNLFILKNDRIKILIIFEQYYLFLSSIFENFTKKYLQILKNKRFSDNEKIYRKEIKKEMKKFCHILKINFYKFYNFLYEIVDNIKHEDSRFYKRYKDFNPKDFLREANEMHLSLKIYIKNILSYSYLFPIKLQYLKQK